MMEWTARTRRMASFAITALLIVLALAFSRVVFQTVDDNAIAMAASGGVTGAPYAGNCSPAMATAGSSPRSMASAPAFRGTPR